MMSYELYVESQTTKWGKKERREMKIERGTKKEEEGRGLFDFGWNGIMGRD